MNYCSIEDAWKNSDSLTDQFKMKNFVYRTSRNVGGSIAPSPQGPIRESF